MAIRVPVVLDVSGDDLDSSVGSEADRAASSASKSWTSKFGGAVVRTGALAVGAVATIGAAVGGLALKGGIDRALNIEDAQAKLRGLGHDAQSIETIMGSALDAVSGTAFGLGDAATIAANAVAAGIPPGKELTRTLSLVGDAATIAGTDLSDMGAIFGQVATAGTLMGDDIAQLQDRGIPILQLVGEQMGVTAQEAKELASEGKVSFDTFRDAIEAGMGGAALASGNTFRGALANVQAALSRLGESVAVPVLTQMTDLFGQVTSAIDEMGPVAERVGSLLGSAFSDGVEFIQSTVIPGMERLFDLFLSGSESIGPMRDIFTDLGGVLLELGATVGATLGQALEALAPVLGFIVALAGQLLTAITPLVTMLVSALGPAIEEIASAFMSELVPAFDGLMPAIQPFVEFMSATFTSTIDGAITAVVGIIRGLITVISGVVNVISGILTGDWSLVWDGLKQVVSGAVDAIGSLLKGVYEIFKGRFAAIGDIISGIGPDFKKAYDSVADWVGNIVRKVRDFPRQVSSFLSNVANILQSRIVAPFQRLNSSVTSRIQSVISNVRRIPSLIMSAIGNLGSLLYQSGRNAIQSLINGIRSQIGSVASSMSGIASTIRSYLPFSPAKVGPLSGSGAPDRSGQEIIRMIAQGMTQAQSLPEDSLTSALMPLSASGVRSSVPRTDGANTGAAPAGGGDVIVNQNFNGPTTSGSRNREMAWTLRFATRYGDGSATQGSEMRSVSTVGR